MFHLTVPMVLGIVSMMMLGLVDSWFVSRLGTSQLAAVSFALPITFLGTSIALGVGMAISSLTSRLIGENRGDESARLISDGAILMVFIAVAMGLLGIATFNPLFRAMGATDDVMPYIREYMVIWYAFTPVMMLMVIGGSALRAIGDTRSSALLTVILAGVNLVMDPLLIFGIGPFPEMGVQGASVATAIASLAALAVAVRILGFRERMLNFARPRMEHLRRNIPELLRIGVPAIAANVMTPIAASVMTAMIAVQGSAAVAGFGVGARLEALCLLVVYALSSTLPMFIGQNVGAGKGHRAWHALTGCLKFVLVLQTIVYVLMLLCAPYIAGLFSDDETVTGVIRLYLLLLPLTYGAHGVVILVMVSLNVLRRPRTALLLSVIRLAIFYLPLAYAGSLLAGTAGLFAGAACGNVIAGIVAYRSIRKVCTEQKIGPEILITGT
jgi:putative MATE family efflux protein